MIQKISAEDLKKMQDREGLVLQGCGGDLREWEDGIHQMLAEEKILQNGVDNCFGGRYNTNRERQRRL